MKYFLIVLTLFFVACEKESVETNSDRAELHAVWESVVIRTKEENPPKRVVLEITAYDKTKLSYMKMTAYGENSQSIEKTIRISLEQKGYIIPSILDEMKDSKSSNRFIWRNSNSSAIQKAYKNEIQQLKWKYYLSGNQLTIEMGASRMILSKKK